MSLAWVCGMEYGGRSESIMEVGLGIGQNWPTHRVGAGGDIFLRSVVDISPVSRDRLDCFTTAAAERQTVRNQVATQYVSMMSHFAVPMRKRGGW